MSKIIKVRKDHFCIRCLKEIPVGTNALMVKFYFPHDKTLSVDRFYSHIKCQCYADRSAERRQRFVCPHPEKMIETRWAYMPGEAVMEPDHQECRVCGKWV